jgi:hypothetical protein
MTARKIDRARAFHEADLAGKSAPADYFDGAMAWSRMQRRITPTLAAELGVPRQMLEDYGNPNRRRRGPHLLLLQTIELAREFKPSAEQRHDVLAPLDWLEGRLGRLAIDLTLARDGKSPASQAQRIAQLLVEFAQFIDCVDEPEQCSPEQRLVAQQQLQDVIDLGSDLLRSFGAQPAALKVAR